MQCSSCLKFIIDKAPKCHHCGSAQNWQKHLGVPSLIIAFILSIVSLFGAFNPLIIELWKGKYVELSVQIIKSDQKGMLLLITNNGTVSLGIKRAYSIPYYEGKEILKTHIETRDWEILDPKKSEIFIANPIKGQIPIMADSYHDKVISTNDCILTIEYESSAINNPNMQIEYPCYLASFSSEAELN